VWSTGGNTYCAIVKYDGEFYAVPGQVGPGNIKRMVMEHGLTQ